MRLSMKDRLRLWGRWAQEVPTQVKSAFTRAFNKSGMKARTTMMVEEQSFSRAKAGKKRKAPSEAELVEGDPEMGQEEVCSLGRGGREGGPAGRGWISWWQKTARRLGSIS